MQKIKYDWYNKEGDEAAKTIFQLINYWDSTQSVVQAHNMTNLRLYSNREALNSSIAGYVLSTSEGYRNSAVNNFNTNKNLISLNVVKSCVDTLTSKIGKNKIRPTFLTTGGTLKQRVSSKKLTNFNFGVLYDSKAYSVLPLVLRDAFIFGTGFVKVFLQNKRIKVERVYPDEIMVDLADGYYNNPNQMFQRKLVSKEAIKELYPDLADRIENVKSISLGQNQSSQDTILIVEGWKLPRGKKPGRHIICIEGIMLQEEVYKDDFYPFAKITYTDPVKGYWGTGVSEELKGIQLEINRLMNHITESMRLLQYPRIFLEAGSKVNPRHITNEIGTIIPYVGAAPIVHVAQTVAPEIFNQLESLYAKSYEIVGISQLSAQSQKPSGLNSGKALQEYNDIETERFATTAQKYEELFIDVSDVIIKCLFKLGNYKANTFDKLAGVQSIEFSEIREAIDEYVIQTFPSSALPTTPAARLSVVNEMSQAGYIEPEVAKQLLDFPDLEAYARTDMAPLQMIQKAIESSLLEGIYIEPEPYQPLNLSVKMAQQYYCWGKLNDAKESNLELVRNYIEDCLSLVTMMVPPPIAPAQQMLDTQLEQAPSVSTSQAPLQGL